MTNNSYLTHRISETLILIHQGPAKGATNLYYTIPPPLFCKKYGDFFSQYINFSLPLLGDIVSNWIANHSCMAARMCVVAMALPC